MPYYDNSCHMDAHENISLPACLIFVVKSKTWQPSLSDLSLLTHYLVADNNVKCETVCCCNATPQISSFQTYGLLTVLSLIQLITGYVDYCSNVFIGNLLKKTERWWTEVVASDWSVVLASSKVSEWEWVRVLIPGALISNKKPSCR